MNVVMPTAMTTMHNDPELASSSSMTAKRGIQVLQALIDREDVLLNIQAILSVATTTTTTTTPSLTSSSSSTDDEPTTSSKSTGSSDLLLLEQTRLIKVRDTDFERACVFTFANNKYFRHLKDTSYIHFPFLE